MGTGFACPCTRSSVRGSMDCVFGGAEAFSGRGEKGFVSASFGSLLGLVLLDQEFRDLDFGVFLE